MTAKVLESFSQLCKQESTGTFLMQGNIDRALTLEDSALLTHESDPEGVEFYVRVQYASATTSIEWENMVAQYTSDGTNFRLERVRTITGSSGGTSINFSSADESLVVLGIPSHELFDSPYDVTGWVADSDTWSFFSSNSFTVASDVASKFPVGTKIKLNNNGQTKYFYVSSASFATETTVNIEGGDFYSLVTGAISAPCYSSASTPAGFPQWFTYTPNYTNLTLGNGVSNYRFTVNGRTMVIKGSTTFGTTSAITGSGVSVSLPLQFQESDVFTSVGTAAFHDFGSDIYLGSIVALNPSVIEAYAINNASPNYSTRGQLSPTIPFTWSSGDQILFTATVSI